MNEKFLAKMTSKGQVTIPQEIREALGLAMGDMVQFSVVDGKLVATIRKVRIQVIQESDEE